jgi:hypothetical protein
MSISDEAQRFCWMLRAQRYDPTKAFAVEMMATKVRPPSFIIIIDYVISIQLLLFILYLIVYQLFKYLRSNYLITSYIFYYLLYIYYYYYYL